MRKLVIFGTTDFSRELCYYVEHDGGDEVVAYVLDQKYVKETIYDGKKVIAYEELESFFAKDEIEIIVSLGYSSMNDNRKIVFERCMRDGWKIGSFIHSKAINLSKSMGIGNIIMDRAEVRLGSEMGDGNVVLALTIISHDCKVGDFNYFAGSNHINGRNKIGSNNFFGTNCILTDGGKIGNYNLIGAGTCVSKKIDDGMLIAQAPTRELKTDKRSMDIFLMNRK